MNNHEEPVDQTPVLSTREAAERLGVSLRTVQLWVESGVLRAWKTAGGHRRIALDSVEQVLTQRAAALEPAPADASRQFRILVVEDDPALRKLMPLVMEGWGLPLQIDTAESGFDGLLRIGEQPPDLLITDLNMPGMDGFQMIRHLHEQPALRRLDIIAVTALRPQDVAARGGLPAGVKCFEKPVPFDELERLVRERVAAKA